MLRPILPVAAAAVLVLTGCQQVSDQVAACPTQPPLQSEQRPLPPVTDYEQVWRPGDWIWNGTGYTWRAGAWIKREGPSTQWLPGHWERAASPGPCAWVPGHWLS